MSLTLFLVGDGEEVLVGLHDDAAHLAGYRKGLLHVAHVAPVEALLTTIIECGRTVDVYVGKVYYGDSITIIQVYRQPYLLALVVLGLYIGDTHQDQHQG